MVKIHSGFCFLKSSKQLYLEYSSSQQVRPRIFILVTIIYSENLYLPWLLLHLMLIGKISFNGYLSHCCFIVSKGQLAKDHSKSPNV